MNFQSSWNPSVRPRRLRQNASIRQLTQENFLRVEDLVCPLFVTEGERKKESIASMPHQFRWSIDLLFEEVLDLYKKGIRAIALFPAIQESLKNERGSEGLNEQGLLPRAIQAIKSTCPHMLVISDIALDPYSSLGHDGLVENGRVSNDPTNELLAQMALVHAKAGADFVAPSDMMDGRVGCIRSLLDQQGYKEVGILSYTAKYASCLYGPFREALDSAPRDLAGVPKNKKTYQMNPANSKEAIRELELDLYEGADIVMVKPAGMYLDVIWRIKEKSSVPVAAYQVSGEYSMIYAASLNGWLNLKQTALESLLSIKRAGADLIFTYFAKEAIEWLRETE